MKIKPVCCNIFQVKTLSGPFSEFSKFIVTLTTITVCIRFVSRMIVDHNDHSPSRYSEVVGSNRFVDGCICPSYFMLWSVLLNGEALVFSSSEPYQVSEKQSLFQEFILNQNRPDGLILIHDSWNTREKIGAMPSEGDVKEEWTDEKVVGGMGKRRLRIGEIDD